MVAFAFTFPAGRYHATPWGRNVNEADVAWPPEPARILRALIATWWRKADHVAYPKALLDGLVDVLAAEEPVFRLPDAVHSHLRAYMPAPLDKKLIFDAFYRFDRDAEMRVVWPEAVLTEAESALAAHLLERIGYLGRAESWVEARLIEDAPGEISAAPRTRGREKITGPSSAVFFLSSPATLVPSDIMVPVDPSAWARTRERLLRDLKERKVPKSKRVAVEASLPERLADALAIDTSHWQAAGWSSPPPLRSVAYDRPSVGPLPPIRQKRATSASDAQPGCPEVARFILAGRPAPQIEEALRIGDLARLALLSKFRKGAVPREILGRDGNGPLRDDPAHAHAFFLPEDDDGDGRIDHLVVYCRRGFSPSARTALDRLTRLWFEHGSIDEETGERPRKEWRLALEDIAALASFTGASRLLHIAHKWRSVTPLFRARFDKVRPRTFDALVDSYRHEIMLEWEKRCPGVPAPLVEPVPAWGDTGRFTLDINGRARSPLSFVRTRHGRGGHRADMSGGFFELTFDGEVQGPIALGWGAHFGLGLFAAVGDC
jgi:CRISPR-associated protein Csb2